MLAPFASCLYRSVLPFKYLLCVPWYGRFFPFLREETLARFGMYVQHVVFRLGAYLTKIENMQGAVWIS